MSDDLSKIKEMFASQNDVNKRSEGQLTQGPAEESSPGDINELRSSISKYEWEVIKDKELRQSLDGIIQRVKKLPTSRERALSITKLQEAVMWLGMDLKRLGEANPYPSSKDPSTGTKIEPTADGLKL